VALAKPCRGGRSGSGIGVKALLASKNHGKLRELQHALPGWEIEPLAADDYPPESGDTYYENARTKAEFARTLVRDTWVLGEDSGLEVDGLDGAPGIRSARFGGSEPVPRLLAALDGMHGDKRRARYVCELVGLSPSGEERRGTEGFGFDPIFVPVGEERTVAELGDAWKADNSHRARAAQAFAAQG
jgi:XTP/dITP diphosphohydrolase